MMMMMSRQRASNSQNVTK